MLGNFEVGFMGSFKEFLLFLCVSNNLWFWKVVKMQEGLNIKSLTRDVETNIVAPTDHMDIFLDTAN